MTSVRERARERASQGAEAAKTIVNNGDGTLREIDGAEGELASCHMLGQMIRRGDPIRGLLLEIAQCPNQGALFYKLRSAHRGKKTWWVFVETVFLLPENVWERGGGSLEEDLVRELTSLALLNRLARPETEVHRQMRAAITSSTHPLFNRLFFDDYWEHQVRRFIECKDWKRAWGAFRAAFRGFRISDIEPDSTDVEKAFWEDTSNRCCRASIDLLQHLVDDLFAAMCRDRVITRLCMSDYSAPSDRRDVQIRHKGGTVSLASKEVFWPGKSLVHSLGRIRTNHEAHVGGGVKRSVRRIGRSTYAVRRFDERGAKIYKMALYFSKQTKPGSKASSFKQGSRRRRAD